MSDILDRAEALAEQYNSSGYIHRDATLLLPELIAEIKRQAAYVARLEAAYLAAKEESLFSSHLADDILQCEERAREALERIKRGEKE